jgi:hypothetical protein
MKTARQRPRNCAARPLKLTNRTAGNNAGEIAPNWDYLAGAPERLEDRARNAIQPLRPSGIAAGAHLVKHVMMHVLPAGRAPGVRPRVGVAPVANRSRRHRAHASRTCAACSPGSPAMADSSSP